MLNVIKRRRVGGSSEPLGSLKNSRHMSQVTKPRNYGQPYYPLKNLGSSCQLKTKINITKIHNTIEIVETKGREREK